LHGSASTWVFNIVRELMGAAFGDANMMCLNGDKLTELPDEPARQGRYLLIKSHHGGVELDEWLDVKQACRILSMRDPRDAAISMSQRFQYPLAHTLPWIAKDCGRIMRLASGQHPLLRYEDRFFDDIVWTKRLAATVARPMDLAVINGIFNRYRTASVRAFAETVTELPPERLNVGPHSTFDEVTQIHNIHIGDTRSGKWRDLPPPVQSELTRYFGPFLVRFGYPTE
jgi:hypothetical protein